MNRLDSIFLMQGITLRFSVISGLKRTFGPVQEWKNIKCRRTESCRCMVYSCRGMLSSYTNSREQHAAAWGPLPKSVFLTHAAACQIMPRHDIKNLKLKPHKPSFFSSFINQFKTPQIPKPSILSTPIKFHQNLSQSLQILSQKHLLIIILIPLVLFGRFSCNCGRVEQRWRNPQSQSSSKFVYNCVIFLYTWRSRTYCMHQEQVKISHTFVHRGVGIPSVW